MAIVSQTPSVSEVKTALAETANSVGGLCTSPKINIWSRYKPVAFPNVATTGDWWKAQYKGVETSQSGDCGVRVPDIVRTTNVNNIKNAIEDVSKNRWEYRHPQGGEDEPFRLGDFRGYNHNAVPPLIANITPVTINVDNQNNLNVHMSLDPDDSTYNLQAYDFMGGIDLSKFKFYGILVNNVSSAIVSSAESDYILDYAGELQGDSLSFINISALDKRNYDLYIVLRNTEYAQGWEFWPLPQSVTADNYNMFPVTITLTSNPADSGAGIEEPAYDVMFLPTLGAGVDMLKHAGYCMEEYGGTTPMRNLTGELNIMLRLINTSNYPRTIDKNEFRLFMYVPSKNLTPQYMYTKGENGLIGTTISSVVVPANGEVSVWLHHPDFLYNLVNPEIEIRLGASNTILLNGVLYYKSGTAGWGY